MDSHSVSAQSPCTILYPDMSFRTLVAQNNFSSLCIQVDTSITNMTIGLSQVACFELSELDL